MNDIFFPQKTGSCSSSGTDWALSIRWISILWISIRKTNCTIHWMEIYSVDESCSVVTRTHLGNAIGWNPTYKPETAWLKFAKFAVNRDFHKRVFRSRGQHLRKFIRTEESVLFTKEKSLTPTGIVWNVAAFSLIWNTNMAAAKSCENALKVFILSLWNKRGFYSNSYDLDRFWVRLFIGGPRSAESINSC